MTAVLQLQQEECAWHAATAHVESVSQFQAVHLVAGPSTRGFGSSTGSSLKAAAAELDAHQYVHRSSAVKGTLIRKDQRPSLQDIFADQPDVQLEMPPDSAQAAGRLPQSAPSASSGRERLAEEEAAVQVRHSWAPICNISGLSQQGDCHQQQKIRPYDVAIQLPGLEVETRRS